MKELLNNKPASEVFSTCNKELSEFIEPGKYAHWDKYDHIKWKDRTDENYKEYVNPSPLKEGYLKLRANISGKLELIPNRDIPIRDYNEPLMYCLYRDLGEDERTDEMYLTFKPQYSQGDKVVLKTSEWQLAQWEYVSEPGDNNEQIQLEGQALEDSWIRAIKESEGFESYTIKWIDNVLWCNQNKTLEERTFYITTIDFRNDHFVYHSYRPTTGRNETQVLREENIAYRIGKGINVEGNTAYIEI